ncbi:MAG: hypothetical protein Q9168_002920 [Polycauliona sp. 1 TL-2023]
MYHQMTWVFPDLTVEMIPAGLARHLFAKNEPITIHDPRPLVYPAYVDEKSKKPVVDLIMPIWEIHFLNDFDALNMTNRYGKPILRPIIVLVEDLTRHRIRYFITTNTLKYVVLNYVDQCTEGLQVMERTNLKGFPYNKPHGTITPPATKVGKVVFNARPRRMFGEAASGGYPPNEDESSQPTISSGYEIVDDTE